jgi:glycosyltransferase involved in cell wall biosynthesis
VLDESRLRDRLRERGLERARQLSWAQTARATIGVYEDVGRG